MESDFWTHSLYLLCVEIFTWIRLGASGKALIYKDTNKLQRFHLQAVADIDSGVIDVAVQRRHFDWNVGCDLLKPPKHP